MTWSLQQECALKSATRRLRERDKQVFRLFGFAGTGKTELAREMGNRHGAAHFASFTGKAAHVMRQRGCDPVSTIHSLIYRAYPDPEDPDRVIYDLRDKEELEGIKLIVVDECSMVGRKLARDLLSFDIPVLAIGDPAQLPPIAGPGYFMGEPPDAMLTEIHRQAANNPILKLADQIRRGEPLPRAGYRAGDALQIINHPGNPDDFDVTLVGLNDTRRGENRMMRHHFGFARVSAGAVPPQIGETLVCFRNDYTVQDNVFNGSLWQVIDGELFELDDQLPTMQLTLNNEYGATSVQVPLECFFEGRFEHYPDLQQFDFGYCLTVHKAQGSEWNAVRLFNEAYAFRDKSAEFRRRWLYTGMTRARERLTIVSYCG
jgi:exodeoxyribonuclease-5